MPPLCELNPLYPEDKYLMEGFPVDPNNGGMFTERAKAAQKAKWKRLFKLYAPMPELDEDMLPALNRKPPLIYYGWPYTEQFLLDYTKRHKIVQPLATIGGRDKLDYSTLTEEDLKDRKFRRVVLRWAQFDVFNHLEARCGYRLELARPFSEQYYCMAALYSNYSLRKRYPVLQAAGVEDVVCELDSAMKEEGFDTDLQWWYDWDNEIGLFTTYA